MKTPGWKFHLIQTVLLALPVCLSNVGNITVDLADNFFIGLLPERTTGQAAVMLASALYIFILVFLIGISYGLTPIVAEADAQKNKEKIITHVRHSFVLNFSISILLFIVLYLAAPLLKYSGKSPEVIALAIKYLNVSMLSMIPLSFFFTCKQFAEGMSDTKTAMVISIIANLMNIFLNWLLVFGLWGLPRMGVMGACWATFFSRCFMAVAMVCYIYFSKTYTPFNAAFNFRKLIPQPVKEQLRIGIPSALMFSLEVAAFAVPTLFIPGIPQLAAHRVSLSLASMTYMISSGLGAAATVRVGHYVGYKDRIGIRRAGFSAVILSVSFMCIAAICFILGRNFLPSLFNKDPEVLHYATTLMLIAAAFQLFDGTQVTTQGALRGLKDTVFPGFIALFAYWMCALPMSYYLCIRSGLGAPGVWYGFIVGLGIACIGFLSRFHWMTKKGREF
ncbi:MAG TPA: MATE family efflux transporter [Bacteroidia bacterium]|jgi:MATE family multidrug resistance protein|nr:MATE family efflux transporter [Bacteroidia bacterium]